VFVWPASTSYINYDINIQVVRYFKVLKVANGAWTKGEAGGDTIILEGKQSAQGAVLIKSMTGEQYLEIANNLNINVVIDIGGTGWPNKHVHVNSTVQNTSSLGGGIYFETITMAANVLYIVSEEWRYNNGNPQIGNLNTRKITTESI